MIDLAITAGRLRDAIQTVTVLVGESKLKVTDNGLRVRTVDETNIGAVDMTLSEEAFDNYSADEMELGLNFQRVEEILSKFDNSEMVELQLDDQNRLVLNVNRYEFRLSLIATDSVQSGKAADSIDPPGMLLIDGHELTRVINFSNMFSDEIILGIDNERVVFYVNAVGDLHRMAVSYDNTDDELEIVRNERAHSIYSLDYLSSMVSAVPPQEQIKLGLGEEYPATISYKFSDDFGEVEYGLAPRIISPA